MTREDRIIAFGIYDALLSEDYMGTAGGWSEERHKVTIGAAMNAVREKAKDLAPEDDYGKELFYEQLPIISARLYIAAQNYAYRYMVHKPGEYIEVSSVMTELGDMFAEDGAISEYASAERWLRM